MCTPKNYRTLLTTPLILSADYDHYQRGLWLKNNAQPPICNVNYVSVIRAGSLYPCFLAYRENFDKTMIERKFGTMCPQPPHCSFSGNGRGEGREKKKTGFLTFIIELVSGLGHRTMSCGWFKDCGSNSERSMNFWRVFQHHSHKAVPVDCLQGIERERKYSASHS
jgi:hypothetical protein